MSPMKMLEDALVEGRNFAGLAGKLRDKFKSGTADLQAILDEADDVIEGALAKARDGLSAFRAEVERVDEEVKEAGASIPDPKVIEATGAEVRSVLTSAGKVPAPVTVTAPSGATVTVDTAAGITTHVASATGVTTTLDHASGSATAVDASVSPAQPVEPAPAAVAEARDAAAAAGVTVPAQG